MKQKTNVGKVCKYCGHVIYYVKRFGYRCMCDRAEPVK